MAIKEAEQNQDNFKLRITINNTGNQRRDTLFNNTFSALKTYFDAADDDGKNKISRGQLRIFFSGLGYRLYTFVSISWDQNNGLLNCTLSPFLAPYVSASNMYFVAGDSLFLKASGSLSNYFEIRSNGTVGASSSAGETNISKIEMWW